MKERDADPGGGTVRDRPHVGPGRPGSADRAAERDRMVERQLAARGIHDARVLAAMREVPRERFVGPEMAEFAYEDAPLPIAAGQTISQPWIVAFMLQALELDPQDRVLEVGGGSGYAAAVLSRIVRRVWTIERHRTLAREAAERLRDLGYDNVQVVAGDGTRGLPGEAPFDAIVVAAGGPEVPPPLLEQLALGGRLVMPVGDATGVQELLRIRRRGPDEYERERLAKVRFVPLVGSAGWALDGAPAPGGAGGAAVRRVRRGDHGSRRARLAGLVRAHCEPFPDLEHAELGPLLERVGDARVVLLGEASHGTSEFYRMRARITRALVEDSGFDAVALEADWPDAAALDARVRPGARPEPDSTGERPFSRFPTWMWRNEEMRAFVDWLAAHNRARADPARRVGIYGLDLYSLWTSIRAVLDFLDRVDPDAARVARIRYGCLSPWERDPAVYGRAASAGRLEACEEEIAHVLRDLLARRLDYGARNGEAVFDAERNAALVLEAERYYRVMYRGGPEAWNLRDRHMFEVLASVLEHRGANARIVVWAHNSHVGDARATAMGRRGELNVGQLARERWSEEVYAIGFGTHTGTVAAADDWDGPMRVMTVRPSHEDSYERVMHDTARPGFLLPLRAPEVPEVREGLLDPRLERAIGVIYRPETELLSHYFEARLPEQFDEWIWMDRTEAVRPLTGPLSEGVPETYPFAL